jgi:3-oxoacyl-[acyl-carrier-protein] synthase-3
MLRKEYGKTDMEIQKTITATGVSNIRHSTSKSVSKFILNSAAKILSIFPTFLSDVDVIIVVTQTYDMRIPSVSTQLQGILELDAETFCIDINDGCAGFIKASRLAKILLQNEREKVLIVSGDLNTVMTEAADPSTRILFGDGFSFCVFEKSEDLSHFDLKNNGRESKTIHCNSNENVMQMNGFEVFRFTRNTVPKLVTDYFMENNITAQDFQLFGFHQASKLVVDSLSSLLKIGNSDLQNYNCGEIGNLGSASIPAWLALSPGLCDEIPRRMLALGYGAGLSWGLGDLFVELNINEVIYVED